MSRNNTFALLFTILFYGGLFAQAVTIQAPFDYATQFFDVFVAENDLGFAVGSCGVLAKTTDGGSNWALEDAPEGRDFHAVACQPGTNCRNVVLGGYGYYARSTDSGKTWSVIENEDWGFLEVLHHVAPDRLIADLEEDFYLESTDGGGTWNRVDLPNDQATNLYFTSADRAYYFNRENSLYVLYQTTDGGANWSALSLQTEGYPRHISFVNENLGFLYDSRKILRKTTDGGQSWTEIPQSNLPSNLTFLIAFSETELRGVQVTDRIYESSDGGSTWTSYSLDLGDGVFIKSSFHRRGDEVWMPSNATEIYYSAGDLQNIQSQLPGERYDLGGIAFEDESTGYAVGRGGRIYKTTDAGDNWELHTQIAGNRAMGAHILPDGRLLVLYNSQPARVSTDGGTTFTEYLPANIRTQLNTSMTALSILPGGRYYLTGSTAAAYSDDQGATWNVVIHELGMSTQTVYFFDDNLGFLAGSNGGRMARTTDGGLTWTDLTAAATTQPVNTFYFTDAMNGIVFNASRSYRTTDGGTSWSLDNNLPGGYDLNVAANGDLYVTEFSSGNNHESFRSQDNGATWQSIGYGCIPSDASTLTPNGNYYFVAGRGGAIFRYDIDVINDTREVAVREITAARIYPNPTDGEIRVEIPEYLSGHVTVDLFDLGGRLLTRQTVRQTERQRIDISSRPAGIYLLRLTGPGWVQSGRIVKN